MSQRILADPALPGQRTLLAIRPVLQSWVERKKGRLTFRLTQLLTGHGCFGAFLCRIGKEATPNCWFCGAAEDTADHTLAHCPRWNAQRAALTAVVGVDLTLPTLVRLIVQDDRKWAAFQRFAEEVLRRKEVVERVRERTVRRRPR